MATTPPIDMRSTTNEWKSSSSTSSSRHSPLSTPQLQYFSFL